MVYEFIKSKRTEYRIETMCQVLQVSRSAYYAYCQGKTHVASVQRQEALAAVKACFEAHQQRYGSRRISKSVSGMGRFAVRSRMKELHLRAIQPKSYVPKTTNSSHKLGYAPNLLSGYQVDRPHGVYVGDITYLPHVGGTWLYLSAWMDLYSRKIVGWTVDTHMQEGIVIASLKQALCKHKPAAGLMIHSDRGGQYASWNFKWLLEQHQCKQSMSGADNPYDNAHMESFFSRFKAECVQKTVFESKQQAEKALFEYIEMYYNTQRIHSSIAYQTPMEYENRYYENPKNATSFENPKNNPDSLRGDGIPSSVLNDIAN